ncbi:MAG: DUF2867 domain-containing protein [Deltaproteobacteria bacterium]|jgi:hypothetical protein|nr:DUF2867 domain-containing protein [Deltaproteobacteria bacterium]
MSFPQQIPEIRPLFERSDYVDIKTVEGCTPLRRFIAAMLSHYPWWVVLLYRIRTVLVKILGLVEHEAPEVLPNLQAEDVSFVAGDTVTFFTVRLANEDQYWVGETPEDKHLKAYFGVVVEPVADNHGRFHVITIVHYKHWTGPVYFNLIRPFHHLVVSRMVRAGVQAKK